MIKFLFILSFTLIALLGSFHTGAQAAMPEPNRSLAMARSAANRIDVQAALKPLFQLAREGKEEQLLRELSEIGQHGNWPVPARERVLHAFATGLADLRAWTVGPVVFDYLENYQPQTLVPHDDHPTAGVPLFNIRSAVMGSANEWRRRSAAATAKQLLARDEQAWLDGWLTASPSRRKGFEDTLSSASRNQLLELGRLSLQGVSQHPSLTTVAARSGLLLSDPVLFRRAIAAGRSPGLAQALRMAVTVFSDRENLALLEFSIREAPAGNAALAMAVLAPGMLDQPGTADLMFQTLDSRKLGSAAALVLSASQDPEIHDRLARMAAAEKTLASKRAALAMGNVQSGAGGDQR
jgi:hypothetical protein